MLVTKIYNVFDFIREFRSYECGENYSMEGLNLLYEYLNEVLDDEEDHVLDVIALCCEWLEYENIDKAKAEYDGIDIREETVVLEGEDSVMVLQF